MGLTEPRKEKGEEGCVDEERGHTYSDAFHGTINAASFNCFQRFDTKSERKFVNKN